MPRATKLATIALLVVGALTAIALIVWSIYIRSTPLSMSGRAGLRSGLELAARVNVSFLGALGGLAAAALALAYLMWRQSKRWMYLVAAIGSALTIGGVWWGRSIIVGLEDPHFVKKSPWVKAATFVATVATVYLAVLCLAAALAWLTSRRLQTPDPR